MNEKIVTSQAGLRGEMAGRWGMGTTGVDVFHWWMEDGVLPGQFEIEEEE